jgi:hypothetical protein
MDRSKSNKGSSANPPSSGRGGGGQPGGYLISDLSGPRGRGGRGRGAPDNSNSNNPDPRNSQPAPFAPFPEGSRIVQGPDGSSLVIDKDGTILTTLYSQPSGSGSSPSSQFADADDFKVPAAQAKKAKQAAARKAREEEHADFFKKGGTHEMLSMILNRTKQNSSGQEKPQPNLKRKKPLNPTPSGVTPPAKKPTKFQPAPPKEGTFAEASQRHAARQRDSRRDREQEYNPYVLHVHTGKNDRGLMNKSTFDAFRQELMKRVLANASSPTPSALRVAYTNWSVRRQAGVIACLDEFTARWYTENVDTIELDTGVAFRAWPMPEGQLGKATFNAKGLNITPEQALILIKAYNKDLGKGIILSRNDAIIAQSGDPIFEIVLDDNAAAVLGTRVPKWKLNLGTDQRLVKYYQKMELAQRLKDDNHELAELFRTTSLTDERVEDTMDTDEAAVKAARSAQEDDASLS